MKAWLKKIDHFLLPRDLNEQFSPYVWLIYLPLFFVPVFIFSDKASDFVWTILATVAFLIAYFHSFWVKKGKVAWHTAAVVLIGTLSAFITPTASSMFIYAAGFAGRLKSMKHGFISLFAILLWVVFITWRFDFQPYFSIPTLVFSFIIGILNIYQAVLDEKKKELILSREETQRLAKVAERERIARDLHDLIGHTFSVITLKADLAGKLLDKDLEKARKEIKQLETISRDALSQVREVVSGYRTSDLLSELANAKHVLASMSIEFEYRFEGLGDKENIETNLEKYLDAKSNKELAIVLRELVTNIIRHAKADEVDAVIKREDGNIVLTVKDNGQGFDNQEHKGFGLKGIEERINKLSGFVVIKSGKPHEGTLSEIGLPAMLKGA
ncbi:sensor histidine kinase [Alteromonadaceae bacterium M269]|nr:sensor histidine kinase [Alteromonadaceae bacterium M269]